MKSNRFELEIESKVENLPVIGDFLAEAMNQLDIEPATASRVQLVVDEACTNVIKHAYSEWKGLITLVLELVDNDLIITIRDRGKPFDPSSVPSPDLEADLDERKIGGLGIYFMRELMDEISYNFDVERGNQIKMKKRLSRG